MLIKYNRHLLNLNPILGQLDFGFHVNICDVECIYFCKKTLFHPEGGYKVYYYLNIYNDMKCKNICSIRYSYNRKYKHIYGDRYTRKIKIYNKSFYINYNNRIINLGLIKEYFFKRKIIKYINLIEKDIYRKSIYGDKKGNILIY